MPDPLRPPLPQDWGSHPTQNSNRYYLRNGYSYELQIWPKQKQGPSEQKPMKNLGERGAWAYPGTTQIFGYPYYLCNARSVSLAWWHIGLVIERLPIRLPAVLCQVTTLGKYCCSQTCAYATKQYNLVQVRGLRWSAAEKVTADLAYSNDVLHSYGCIYDYNTTTTR